MLSTAPLPLGARLIQAASHNGKIYAVGGELVIDVVTRTVFELDPLATNPAWVERTSLLDIPQTNAFPVGGVASSNGHLYAIGPEYNLEFTITSTPPPPAGASVLAVPSQTDVFVGDPLSVDLNVAGASDLYAMQADCTVDPAVLTLENAAFGSLFDPLNNLVGSNNPDPLAGSWSGAISQRNPALPITGAGTMATLSFTGAGPGTTSVTCTLLLSDQNGFTLPFTYTGATINVLDATILVNGTVVYQGRLDHAGIQVTFSQNGSQVGSATTDLSGAFSYDQLTAGDYLVRASAPSYLPRCTNETLTTGQVLNLSATTLLGGDTNGDEAIDIGDATLLAASFGLGVPPGNPQADINADALVNVQDLAILGGNYGLSGCQPW
jgi:hypothetical protein